MMLLRYLHGARPALKGPAPLLYRLGRCFWTDGALGDRNWHSSASSSFSLADFDMSQRIPDNSARSRGSEEPCRASEPQLAPCIAWTLASEGGVADQLLQNDGEHTCTETELAATLQS
jgi:hypothetical protein